MAKNTDLSLQKQVIYSVYVRNHTEEGTFRAVIGDLDRIRALGTDIIWFLPIHPIGVKGKKGSLGCPYANRDYRSVNPAYGTMADFRALVDAVHARGMKVMIAWCTTTPLPIPCSMSSTPNISITARTESPATRSATGAT